MNLLSEHRITKSAAYEILQRVQRHYNDRRFQIGLDNVHLTEWLELVECGGIITDLILKLQREIENHKSEPQTETFTLSA